MDLSKLKEPFPPEKISWRVGSTTQAKDKGMALAYIDPRDVMGRLDEVCGPENWQALHPHANGKTSCKIGIKIDGEWIWKENGAGDTDFEADKGAFSDSFKRAAVLWGIGRYLYDTPNVWVEIEPMGKSYKIANPKDARLIGALEKAAAIQRGEKVFTMNEGVPNGPPPFTETEMKFLQDKLDEAETSEEFENVKDLARAAYPRMSQAQKTKTTKAINERAVWIGNKSMDQQMRAAE